MSKAPSGHILTKSLRVTAPYAAVTPFFNLSHKLLTHLTQKKKEYLPLP